MKISVKRMVLSIMFVLMVFNIWILGTDKTFFYKAIYYNFANIDDYKIFSQRLIHKGNKTQPWTLAKSYNKIKIPESLHRQLEEINSVAFLIIKDDSLYYEEYWDGYDKDSYSNSFSMAKSMVSVLVGAAIQDGRIKSVEQKVGEFLPEFNEGEKAKIKIKHLLTMSGGTDWNESYSNPLSVTTAAYYGEDLKKLIDSLGMEREPGTLFDYKSGDTQILGFLLEKATKKTLSHYAEERLWKPLGAENDAIWSTDKTAGMEKAFCCVNSNARDFARLGSLYLHKGAWKGARIVPQEYVEASVKPNLLKNIEGDTVDYYGYSWWTIPDYKGQDIFYCRGILGQYVIVIPEKNIVVVRLGKSRGKKKGYHFEEVYSMIDAVNKIFK